MIICLNIQSCIDIPGSFECSQSRPNHTLYQFQGHRILLNIIFVLYFFISVESQLENFLKELQESPTYTHIHKKNKMGQKLLGLLFRDEHEERFVIEYTWIRYPRNPMLRHAATIAPTARSCSSPSTSSGRNRPLPPFNSPHQNHDTIHAGSVTDREGRKNPMFKYRHCFIWDETRAGKNQWACYVIRRCVDFWYTPILSDITTTLIE